MNYLAIDTSGEHLFVAVKAGENLQTRYLKNCLTKHSLTLLPEVESALSAAGCELKNLDFIAAVTGPGSFTGIRIGVSTAKALCFSLNKPALNITSFDVLAYNDKASEKLLCLIDAKHDNFYAQTFIREKNGQILKGEPQFINKADISEKYSDYKIVSDVKIENVNSLVADIPAGVIAACEEKSGGLTDYHLLAPLYVKRSQAEEEALCK
ncbi:MAG: tRNA (adenosine(37)-N6)-threonylcarbamoyltransferase complex dimerization subunit type 1 TsaB [Candidatus Borkfalkiaceae bacterium]|nr:tRNA (adenosine(37)-N6)-threonylcarbamoyltransferase complex dimerization subunit type 1 TsaB [Christensenellaceae bacterium]